MILYRSMTQTSFLIFFYINLIFLGVLCAGSSCVVENIHTFKQIFKQVQLQGISSLKTLYNFELEIKTFSVIIRLSAQKESSNVPVGRLFFSAVTIVIDYFLI